MNTVKTQNKLNAIIIIGLVTFVTTMTVLLNIVLK